MAEREAGRPAGSVTLVAVSKTKPVEAIEEALGAGQLAFGENYAQEVREKASALEALRASGVSVQFIGQLQTNKVRMITGLVDCVASVDRASLVDEIAKRMPSTRIHLQVNATGETSKGGCLPDALPELITRARDQGLYVEGLMAVGPTSAREDETRAAFRCVDELASEHDLPIRNYGMSGDLNIAIEQGSTMVRVGSAILGNRN